MRSFRGKSVKVDSEYLHVELEDARIVSTPLRWYKELQEASMEVQQNYQFIGRKSIIEWPDIDLHLGIEEMFVVIVKEQESAA
ncbi:DUF2442 domain-containing protein [Deltaproteobacteria bacterium TL4]